MHAPSGCAIGYQPKGGKLCCRLLLPPYHRRRRPLGQRPSTFMAHRLMRAAAFNTLGGPEVLVPVLWSKPTAAPGRVLVRVIAAGGWPLGGMGL